MNSFDVKRISDPVHGTVGLSNIELQVISTRAFQRLRNVRQLGLAHFVFPGADYSRFSHSVGVCHITGVILGTLRRSDPNLNIKDEEIQLYRLAALLHDVGHYPYSHTMEYAIKDYYVAGLLAASPASGEEHKYYMHDQVGQRLLLADSELRRVLQTNDIEPTDVSNIFMRVQPPRFANLISSDLDADRIDFLLRTAHHTGLPYGSMDVAYLLSQLRIDNQERICLTAKALRTADHFLLGRYFDYQQVAYHKTVAASELVLKDVIAELLKRKMIDCSAEQINKIIEEDRWCNFDDAYILQKIRELHESTKDEMLVRLKAEVILNRKPPKLIVESEYIAKRDDHETRNFLAQKQSLVERISEWAAQFNIDKSLWYVWSLAGRPITKVGASIPVSTLETDSLAGIDEERAQEIRVLDASGNASSLIVDKRYSLMHSLSKYALYALRLYVLFPEGEEKKRDDIRQRIKDALPHLYWK